MRTSSTQESGHDVPNHDRPTLIQVGPSSSSEPPAQSLSTSARPRIAVGSQLDFLAGQQQQQQGGGLVAASFDADDANLGAALSPNRRTIITNSNNNNGPRRRRKSHVEPCATPTANAPTSADPGTFPEDREDDLFGPPDSALRSDYAPEKFHASVFVYEFLTHLLFPLSLPVILGVDGLVGARAKYFMPRAQCPHALLSIKGWLEGIVHITPFVLVAVFGVSWLSTLVVIAWGFPVFRFFTIAGKYASFPQEQYRRKMRDPHYDLVEDVLIASWFTVVSSDKITAELDEAEAFTGADLATLPFLRLLDGTTCCPRRLMWLLLRRVYQAPPPTPLTVLVNVLAYTVIAWPLLAYYVHFTFVTEYETFFGTGVPGSPVELLILLLLMMQLYLTVPSVFLFMYIAMIHHIRGYRVQRVLLDAVMPSGHSRVRGDATMLRLSDDGNLFGWDRMRLVGRYFGRIYANRVSFNTIATVAVSAAAFVKLAFERLIFGVDLLGHSALPATALVLYLFTVASVAGFVTILYAVMTNRADILAAETLANEELALFFDRNQPTGGARDGLDNTNKNGSSAEEEESLSLQSAGATTPTQAAMAGGGDDDDNAGNSNGNAAEMTPSEAQGLYYRLKAMRSALGQRQRVEPVEIMYVPARPRLLTGYLAFLVSAATVTVGLVFASPSL